MKLGAALNEPFHAAIPFREGEEEQVPSRSTAPLPAPRSTHMIRNALMGASMTLALSGGVLGCATTGRPYRSEDTGIVRKIVAVKLWCTDMQIDTRCRPWYRQGDRTGERYLLVARDGSACLVERGATMVFVLEGRDFGCPGPWRVARSQD